MRDEHLRELASLPGDRRLPRRPRSSTSSSRPGSPARSVRPPPAGDPGRPRRGLRPRPSAPRCAPVPRSSNGRERGTTSSASATASGCSCAGEPLAHDRLDGLAPLGRHGREVVCGDEPLHPTLAQPPRQRVPARERPARGGRVGIIGRRDQPQRRDALGVTQGEAQRRVRAHRGAGQHRALDVRARRAPPPGRGRVARSRRRSDRARRRAAVPARVVGDRRDIPSAQACASPSPHSDALR